MRKVAAVLALLVVLSMAGLVGQAHAGDGDPLLLGRDNASVTTTSVSGGFNINGGSATSFDLSSGSTVETPGVTFTCSGEVTMVTGQREARLPDNPACTGPISIVATINDVPNGTRGGVLVQSVRQYPRSGEIVIFLNTRVVAQRMKVAYFGFKSP
jgi:hypothetical protein